MKKAIIDISIYLIDNNNSKRFFLYGLIIMLITIIGKHIQRDSLCFIFFKNCEFDFIVLDNFIFELTFITSIVVFIHLIAIFIIFFSYNESIHSNNYKNNNFKITISKIITIIALVPFTFNNNESIMVFILLLSLLLVIINKLLIQLTKFIKKYYLTLLIIISEILIIIMAITSIQIFIKTALMNIKSLIVNNYDYIKDSIKLLYYGCFLVFNSYNFLKLYSLICMKENGHIKYMKKKYLENN